MISDMATESTPDRDNIAVALRVLKDRRAVPGAARSFLLTSHLMFAGSL